MLAAGLSLSAESLSKLLMPGTSLRPESSDDRIPILLFKRSLQSSAATDSTHSTAVNLSGWTIIAPAGWASSCWHSLVYADTRVGGIREQTQQSFEAALPAFPFDWVCTSAHARATRKQAMEAEAKWDRTPSGKRVNYAALETKNPWKPDLDAIVARQCLSVRQNPDAAEPGQIADVSGQPVTEDPISTDSRIGDVLNTPWLMPSGLVSKTLAALAKLDGQQQGDMSENVLGGILIDIIAHDREKRGLFAIGADASHKAVQRALLHISIQPVQRGRPKQNAMIYALDIAAMQAARTALKPVAKTTWSGAVRNTVRDRTAGPTRADIRFRGNKRQRVATDMNDLAGSGRQSDTDTPNDEMLLEESDDEDTHELVVSQHSANLICNLLTISFAELRPGGERAKHYWLCH